MLFDLTRVSGQRVDQVDELQLAGRHWVRSTDVFIALGGAFAGAIVAQGIRSFIGGGYIPYFLIPIAAVLAVVFFSRKRSIAGEVNRRRIEKIVDARRVPDGKFVLPGTAPFSVNDFELMEVHDHPYAP